jgi:DNA mismatch repair ATPase MutS
LESLQNWLEAPSYLRPKSWVRIIRWLLPLFTVAAAYYYLDTGLYYALLVGIMFSFGITTLFGQYISSQHELLSKKFQVLRQYASILRSFARVEPGSASELRQLGDLAAGAHAQIRKLSRLSQHFDQRLNKVANVLLNAFFLYDIHLIIALEKWKEENKSKLATWISCVGKIECLNSLSTFAYNHPAYVYPTMHSGPIEIQAKQLAHPLLPARERVANDFSIGVSDRLQLITGSNMSGKTTFLRTVGVNLLLAQLGAPVCAAEFSFSPMGILSSLRITDSLQERTSYFMAELKKLQSIVANLGHGLGHLVLIDEILRGTNSEDKTHGSERFIEKLLEMNCVTLFATHDLNLSKMQDRFPERITNYCFESNIVQGELYFDYRLRPGIAKNKNASFLMAQMGII